MTVLLVIQDFISLDYGKGVYARLSNLYLVELQTLFYFGTKSFNLRSTTPPDNLYIVVVVYHDIVQYPMIITYDFLLDMEIHQILPEARDRVAMHF